METFRCSTDDFNWCSCVKFQGGSIFNRQIRNIGIEIYEFHHNILTFCAPSSFFLCFCAPLVSVAHFWRKRRVSTLENGRVKEDGKGEWSQDQKKWDDSGWDLLFLSALFRVKIPYTSKVPWDHYYPLHHHYLPPVLPTRDHAPHIPLITLRYDSSSRYERRDSTRQKIWRYDDLEQWGHKKKRAFNGITVNRIDWLWLWSQ